LGRGTAQTLPSSQNISGEARTNRDGTLRKWSPLLARATAYARSRERDVDADAKRAF